MDTKAVEKALKYWDSLPEKDYNLTREKAIKLLVDHEEHVLAQRWVSVEERLPEDQIAKLVYVMEIRCTFTAIYRDGQWHAFSPGTSSFVDFVTHWQPLPEPPKETK